MRKFAVGACIALISTAIAPPAVAGQSIRNFSNATGIFRRLPIEITYSSQHHELHLYIREAVEGFGGTIHPFQIRHAGLKEFCLIGTNNTLRVRRVSFHEGVIAGNEITFFDIPNNHTISPSTKCGGIIGLKMLDNTTIFIDPTDCWMNSVSIGWFDDKEPMPLFTW